MADRYPDVTIRDYGAKGVPAGRLQPMEASHLKAGKWILEPKTGNPCSVVDQPKKSKTGKHGSAKITCKLKMGFSHKTAQLMAPGHQQLQKALIEKVEYTFAYLEDEDEDVITVCVMDDEDETIELKMSKAREAAYKKVMSVIEEGEKEDKDVVIIVQEGPRRDTKDAKGPGYIIYQLITEAKIVQHLQRPVFCSCSIDCFQLAQYCLVAHIGFFIGLAFQHPLFFQEQSCLSICFHHHFNWPLFQGLG